jgi:hypothetical protein
MRVYRNVLVQQVLRGSSRFHPALKIFCVALGLNLFGLLFQVMFSIEIIRFDLTSFCPALAVHSRRTLRGKWHRPTPSTGLSCVTAAFQFELTAFPQALGEVMEWLSVFILCGLLCMFAQGWTITEIQVPLPTSASTKQLQTSSQTP